MSSLTENGNSATQTLLFSTDEDETRVLALHPPFITGYKNLPDNVAGVNRNMVNSDRRGLLGYIFPYLKMNSTDKICLFFEQDSRPVPVGEFFEVGAYINQPVPFYIKAEQLDRLFASPIPVPGVLPLYYDIKRLSGNDGPSLHLPLLYKPFGPGEADARLDLPNNQGLALPIPSETVIDKNVIANGMFVTVPQYQYQAVGDVVYLAVGPRELMLPVSTLGSLLFELTPALLASLPVTDKVSIAYEINDIVHNGSGWSSNVSLSLKPTELLLTAPVFDEATPGIPDDLGYEALNGTAATILINEQFSVGDIVTLTLTLTTAVADIVERDPVIINVTRNTRSLSYDLENGYVQNAIGGKIDVSYTRSRSGVLARSKSYFATVSGLVLPAAAPSIDEQRGEELPADTALAHVRIPDYWPLLNNATVQLLWQVVGTDGVTHLYIFGQVIVDATQPVIFTVGSEYIERFESSPLTVLYKIENPGRRVVQSESLNITVGTAAQLPAPVFSPQPPDNRLQPLDMRHAATVLVRDPTMSSSKRYSLSVSGRTGFGSPMLSAQQGNNSGELLFNLPLTAVPANIGAYMRLSCTVTESGKPDRVSGVRRYEVLPVLNPDINFPPMSIKEATPDNILNLNSFTDDAHWSLPAYLFIAVGTRLRVALSGNDSEHVVMLFDDKITAAHVRDGLSGTIDRQQLKLYKDGTQVFGLSIANFSDQGGVDTFFPLRQLTIKTEMLDRPVITQLLDNNGAITGQVPNGGSCDDTTPVLVGTATPDSVIHIYVNGTYRTNVTASPGGIWQVQISVGYGNHTLIAKTPDNLQTSLPWEVAVMADLNEQALGVNPQNGWIVGPAATTDGYFQNNMWGFIFLTNTNSRVTHAGILLYKELPVRPGITYRFSAELFNWSGTGLHDPLMDLAIMDQTLLQTGPFTPLRDSTPHLFQLQFTATTTRATFYIRSLKNETNGNDMAIRNIRVEQLNNGTRA